MGFMPGSRSARHSKLALHATAATTGYRLARHSNLALRAAAAATGFRMGHIARQLGARSAR
jgi:hypothetical protein